MNKSSRPRVPFSALLVGLIALLIGACGTPAPQTRSETAGAPESCTGSGVIDSATSVYGRSLIKSIGSAAFYPQEALIDAQSGMTVLCVRIARSGEILKAIVAQSSGFPLLDGSALYAVGKVYPIKHAFESVPSDLMAGQDSAWFLVPVRFVDADHPGNLQALPPPACHPIPDHHFYSSLQKGLQKNIFYPPDAVEMSEAGTALVHFEVRPDGTLTHSRILKSAGDPLFDGAALLTIGFLSVDPSRPCPPPELTADGNDLTIEMPINWQMR